MARKDVLCVVGARPNFMKMAPLIPALRAAGVSPILLHTGQHYDEKLSKVFFEELGMPEPDVYLGVGSGSHAAQTAAVMTAFEPVCLERLPGLVIVVGDVNSTIACSLVASKLDIPVAHVEAGLRSFDRAMPEEINRVCTDHISDLLFVSERSGSENLQHEGIDEEKIHFVGNCMIDTLLQHVERARETRPWEELGLEPGGYVLVTAHRPSNVDDVSRLVDLLETLGEVAKRLPIYFPVHPRTRHRMEAEGIEPPTGVRLAEPIPYLSFVGLMSAARCVLTDSGGIQEETTALGVPCLTMRENTERPITIELGTNRLVGTKRSAVLAAVDEVVAGRWSRGERPPLWDGKAAPRIAEAVARFVGA